MFHTTKNEWKLRDQLESISCLPNEGQACWTGSGEVIKAPEDSNPILAWPTITLSDEKCEFTVKEFESTNFVCKVNATNIRKSQRKGDRKQSPYLPALSETQWLPSSQTSPLHDPHNSTAPVCETTSTDIRLASAIAAPHHDRITNRCQVLGTFTNLVRSTV